MLMTGKRWLQACVIAMVVSTGLATAVDAQTYSYTRIETNGNLRIDDVSLIRISGLPESGTVTATELNAAFRAISDRALFEDISIIPRGNVLEINVVEFPTISRIAFEGNRTINDEQLETVILSNPREVFVPARIENDADRLAEAYFNAGRYAATVTPKIIRRSQNRVDVVFEIIEGRVVEIESITFIGNVAFSDARLRRVLETKQAGILRTFTTTDTYLPDRIERDKTLLRDFYLSRGFVDFRVLSATTELSRSRDSLSVVFKVEEGQPYTIREVTVSSELPGVDPALYHAESRIRPGDRYNPVTIDDSVKRMEFLASQQGMEFIQVTPDIDPVGLGVVDITFIVEQDSPLVIDRIEIFGNDTTVDRVIRRHFERVEGDPFDPESLERTADRIRALGLFASVETDVVPVSETDVVINTRVEERSTGSLGVGLTYSKQAGVGYTASLTERNLLGRGQTLGLSIGASDDERTYTLYFIEPYLFDRDLEFGLNLANQGIENFAGYVDYDEFDLGTYLAFPISERGRLTTDISFTQQKTKRPIAAGNRDPDRNPVDLVYSKLIDRDFKSNTGKRDLVSLGVAYTHDTISSGVYTDRGFRFSISQRLSFGEGTIAKTQASAIGQTVQGRATLQARLSGGFVTQTGNQSTHLLDRFHSSSSIIRGFESYGIGPRTVLAKLPLGGNKFASLQLEALYPISTGDINITGALFTDAATIWGLDETDDKQNNRVPPGDNDPDFQKLPKHVDDRSRIRSTAGVGVILGTPVGPLRLNFTRALKSYPDDKTQSFTITFGSTF